MIVECPSCARMVNVAGLPATCPNCERRIDSNVVPTHIAPASQSHGSMLSPAPAARPDHDDVYHAPYYEPPPPPTEWKKPVILGIAVALGAILLFVGGILIRNAVKTLLSAPPPPAPTAPAPGSVMPARTSVVETPRIAPPPAPAPAPPPPQPIELTPHAAETVPADPVTDEAINTAINRGVTYLIKELTTGQLADGDFTDRQQGEQALAVQALLYAGQSTFDERLSLSGEFMTNAIDRMKASAFDGTFATYCRSIRLTALSLHNRPVDRETIRGDLDYLLGTHRRGSYTYSNVPGDTNDEPERWDNSNTQYGTLGVWAAAEAGYSVSPSYWEAVQRHWNTYQSPGGGWDYHSGRRPNITMTSAGVNMLFVAHDQLNAASPIANNGESQFSPALQGGLDWLARGDNSITLNQHTGYALYGLERAGLASGFKRFGKHDWFRVLAAEALKSQKPDGSWNGADRPIAETAFHILFLSRGRNPLTINKLRFAGAWNNRSRDLMRLNRFIFDSIERPVNWQVVSATDDWTDWMDAPILYLASHRAPELTPEQIDKLRAFAEAGGLIYTQADINSDAFNRWIEDVAARLWPDYPLEDLPGDHPIFSSLYPLDTPPELKGISNGSRLLLVHSPKDLAARWQFRTPAAAEMDYHFGVNMFLYATGKAPLRQRLDTLAVPQAVSEPLLTMHIGQLQRAGNWNPEPAAWPRMARLFQNDTNIALDVQPVDIEQLNPAIMPLVHVTGTAGLDLNAAQTNALRQYVRNGGVVFVDVTGGNRDTAAALRKTLTSAFAGVRPEPLAPEHPILAGSLPGMTALEGVGLRVYAVSRLDQAPTMELMQMGEGAVIFSGLDIASGWLGTNTWGIVGYEPSHAQALAKNILLWTADRRNLLTVQPEPSSTEPR